MRLENLQRAREGKMCACVCVQDFNKHKDVEIGLSISVALGRRGRLAWRHECSEQRRARKDGGVCCFSVAAAALVVFARCTKNKGLTSTILQLILSARLVQQR